MVKQYYCDQLNNVISCFHDGIVSCCSGQDGPEYYKNINNDDIKNLLVITVFG